MTIPRELADAVRAIFADIEPVDEPDDTIDFRKDIAHLNALADCMIELRLPESGHLFYGCGETVYDQTVADLSPAARREIRAATFGVWP